MAPSFDWLAACSPVLFSNPACCGVLIYMMLSSVDNVNFLLDAILQSARQMRTK